MTSAQQDFEARVDRVAKATNATPGELLTPPTAGHHTFCQYWPSSTWWATYLDGEMLDVYPSRDLAEGYVNYMNGRR